MQSVNVSDLPNVLGSPLQTTTSHGADRPEREHLVEPVVDVLFIVCEGQPEGGAHCFVGNALKC